MFPVPTWILPSIFYIQVHVFMDGFLTEFGRYIVLITAAVVYVCMQILPLLTENYPTTFEKVHPWVS